MSKINPGWNDNRLSVATLIREITICPTRQLEPKIAHEAAEIVDHGMILARECPAAGAVRKPGRMAQIEQVGTAIGDGFGQGV